MDTNVIVNGLKVDAHYTQLHLKDLGASATTKVVGRVAGTLRIVSTLNRHTAGTLTFQFTRAYKGVEIAEDTRSMIATANISQVDAK